MPDRDAACFVGDSDTAFRPGDRGTQRLRFPLTHLAEVVAATDKA